MHAQESISLVFDLKSVFGFSLEIIFVSFLGSSFLLKSKSYGLAIEEELGPLAKNCRWTLLTQLTDRF